MLNNCLALLTNYLLETRKIQILPLFFLILLFLSNISRINADNIEADALQDIYDRGYLLIGSDTTYPPFEEFNSNTGQAEGFDIDIAHQLAIALGVEVKIQTSEWDAIIPNLINNDFDIILSAMTITEEREEVVDFTRWYYKIHQAILVNKGNPLGILTEADLNATLTIGVQAGTNSDIWAQLNLNSSVTLYTYNTIELAIGGVKQGSVDLVLGDYSRFALDEQGSDQTEVVATFAVEPFGIACRTGDDTLRLALNSAISLLLGLDVNNPYPSHLYNTIHYKWFGIHSKNLGYTGVVIDEEIPYVWYEEPSTTTSSSSFTESTSTTEPSTTTTDTEPVITSGFSILTLIGVLSTIFYFKRRRENL